MRDLGYTFMHGDLTISIRSPKVLSYEEVQELIARFKTRNDKPVAFFDNAADRPRPRFRRILS